MSMYNMTQGVDPYSKIAIGLLHQPESITQNIAFGRLRDAFFEIDEGVHRIRVHTRNGGGNRDSYVDEINGLRSHPWFYTDEDCSHDSTYADFVFTIPDELVSEISEAAGEHAEKMWVAPVDHQGRFQAVLDSIGKPAAPTT